MKFKSPSPFTIGIITILVICGFLLASDFEATGNSMKEISGRTSANSTQKQPKVIDTGELYAQVLPPEGIIFPGTWQNIGPKLVASGAIDLEKFIALYNSSGRPLTEEQIAFFTKGSNETIRMTPENAHFILNTLWALGLVNKNPVLSEGLMVQYITKGEAGNFASTGGWSLGMKPGGELLNSAEIITLTPEQQAVVERVARSSYRPCCGNPTAFPDCNHGAAALGLAQLLASQNATADQIAAALKAANGMWFSQQYFELAVYFKAAEDKDWNDVDPWVVVSKEYSSSSGWANIHKKLNEMSMLPQAPFRGGSCGVGTK
ncbi:MAG TPA: hypothetical protein VN316_02330 [candidate division Zixibacteria bacterium]|nr:hypothetical protein [candidate division Zixibacteria bacterium]